MRRCRATSAANDADQHITIGHGRLDNGATAPRVLPEQRAIRCDARHSRSVRQENLRTPPIVIEMR